MSERLYIERRRKILVALLRGGLTYGEIIYMNDPPHDMQRTYRNAVNYQVFSGLLHSKCIQPNGSTDQYLLTAKGRDEAVRYASKLGSLILEP